MNALPQEGEDAPGDTAMPRAFDTVLVTQNRPLHRPLPGAAACVM